MKKYGLRSRKPRLTAVRIFFFFALTTQHPLPAKVGTKFADKRRSLCRYSSFVGLRPRSLVSLGRGIEYLQWNTIPRGCIPTFCFLVVYRAYIPVRVFGILFLRLEAEGVNASNFPDPSMLS
jgi:hypothetical protein